MLASARLTWQLGAASVVTSGEVVRAHYPVGRAGCGGPALARRQELGQGPPEAAHGHGSVGVSGQHLDRDSDRVGDSEVGHRVPESSADLWQRGSRPAQD